MDEQWPTGGQKNGIGYSKADLDYPPFVPRFYMTTVSVMVSDRSGYKLHVCVQWEVKYAV